MQEFETHVSRYLNICNIFRQSFVSIVLVFAASALIVVIIIAFARWPRCLISYFFDLFGCLSKCFLCPFFPYFSKILSDKTVPLASLLQGHAGGETSRFTK